MDIRNFESILTVGENVAVEFKRCGSGIGNDVYESICSFLNRLNNPVPVSLLSGDRKSQIRFLGNHHSGSGNLYHKSFRM